MRGALVIAALWALVYGMVHAFTGPATPLTGVVSALLVLAGSAVLVLLWVNPPDDKGGKV